MDQFVNIGSVSLYEDDGAGGYTYEYVYKPSDYAASDLTINLSDNMGFGASMDLTEDHVIIGCPFESPNDALGNSVWENRDLGAVYIFDRSSKDLIQKIIPDNTPGSWAVGSLNGTIRRKHNFGYSISSGDGFLVIGAPGYVDNISSTEYPYSGRSYVYKWNPGSNKYELTYTISPSSKTSNNRFGDTVMVDGNNIVISNSPKANSAISGIVRYITMNSTFTGATNDVKITNTHLSWKYSLAADQGRIAIGLHDTDTVNIYQVIDGIAVLKDTIVENRLKSFELGYDLTFDGERILVGSPNGYYKLGVVLRFGKVAGKYKLI